MDSLTQSFRNALKVLEPGKDDRIIVICDSNNRQLANNFLRACQDEKYKCQSYDLGDKRPYKSIPQQLRMMIEKCKPQIVINLFISRGDELTFRVNLLRAEHTHGAKVGHVLDANLEIFERYMFNEFEGMRKDVLNFFNYLNGKKINQIEAKTEKGTNLRLKVSARKWYTDVKIEPRSAGNFPCGEVFIAPIEKSVNGLLVADVAVGDFPKQDISTKLVVKEGQVDVSQIDGPLSEKLKEVFQINGAATLAGEFGIGFNKNIRIDEVKDTVLLEKAYGTAHLAFGSNEDFGGKNRSNIHIDFVFDKPDVFIDGVEIIHQGNLMVEEI